VVGVGGGGGGGGVVGWERGCGFGGFVAALWGAEVVVVVVGVGVGSLSVVGCCWVVGWDCGWVGRGYGDGWWSDRCCYRSIGVVEEQTSTGGLDGAE